jgi:hypothetical protein
MLTIWWINEDDILTNVFCETNIVTLILRQSQMIFIYLDVNGLDQNSPKLPHPLPLGNVFKYDIHDFKLVNF